MMQYTGVLVLSGFSASFFWHYSSKAVNGEVLIWGMTMSERNPSIAQQVSKFKYPRMVYTLDLYRSVLIIWSTKAFHMTMKRWPLEWNKELGSEGSS